MGSGPIWSHNLPHYPSGTSSCTYVCYTDCLPVRGTVGGKAGILVCRREVPTSFNVQFSGAEPLPTYLVQAGLVEILS